MRKIDTRLTPDATGNLTKFSFISGVALLAASIFTGLWPLAALGFLAFAVPLGVPLLLGVKPEFGMESVPGVKIYEGKAPGLLGKKSRIVTLGEEAERGCTIYYAQTGPVFDGSEFLKIAAEADLNSLKLITTTYEHFGKQVADRVFGGDEILLVIAARNEAHMKELLNASGVREGTKAKERPGAHRGLRNIGDITERLFDNDPDIAYMLKDAPN